MASAIPGFKQALADRLEEFITPSDDLLVTNGNPRPLSAAVPELIAIGQASRRPLDLVGGWADANEEFSLLVIVSVVKTNKVPKVNVEARAYDLADEVMRIVLSWNEVNCDGHAIAVLPSDSADSEEVDDKTRECAVTLTFDVTARVNYGSQT